MKDNKERLDVLLIKKGYLKTREKARKNILAGLVFVNNIKIDKPGEKVDIYSNIEIKGEAVPYVSRGGLKLEKAINEFNLNLKDKIAMDVGASTGGFTDCMLKNGAARVYAVDVGYGQLDCSLLEDDRVISMEKTNIRYLSPDDIGEKVDFVSIDVSFISLKLVIPSVKEVLNPFGQLVALIKPQFEAGKEKVGKKGVVKGADIHEKVLMDVINSISLMGFTLKALTYSPIKGPEGNIEYLSLFIYNDEHVDKSLEECIKNVVKKSHEAFDK